MTIEVVTEVPEVEDDLFTEEGSLYNMRELLDMVVDNKDVIFTVPTGDVESLKQGLIMRKAKDQNKMKKAGLVLDAGTLSFLVYPSKNEDGTERAGASEVRVKLAPKKSVTILDVRIPSDEL